MKNQFDTESISQPSPHKPPPPRGRAGAKSAHGTKDSSWPHGSEVGALDNRQAASFSHMPPIRRLSLAPAIFDRSLIRNLWRKIKGQTSSSKDRAEAVANSRPLELDWRRKARRRRVLLALLVLGQTAVAIDSLARTFPHPQLSALEIAILVTFGILFSWISFSFWATVAGFFTLIGRIKLKPVGAPEYPKEYLERLPTSRIAVLIPICNEEVARVFAGVEASYRSLAATEKLANFDFFFLSDTSDPDKQIEEECAWARICERVDGFGKIFYRHRRVNIKRKSGNIGDFLRRWGQAYDYMIVFDADSIMAGETMICMTNMMDLHPQVGILQTTPTIVNRESLFARVQQFASRIYGPVFAAGLRFWQGGESYYWGHNAILRVMPFAQHCGLARLPGQPPLGGEILSHDFVEAALMGRAGWEVWIVDDLPGSFEESPPTILDELKRDRRWCQGNLQHLRLIAADGFRFGHRAIMAMGIMAYASAFFWAIFLVLSTAEVVVESLVPPVYFPAQPSLFPIWPRWHPEIAVTLLGTTAVMLFLGKLLSSLLVIASGQASEYGGTLRLGMSVIVEIVISTFLAPLRMWFHSKYVLLTLLGREIKWGAQRRDGAETGWFEALSQHGVLTIVGLTWTAALFWLNPLLAGWLLPVTLPMSFSIPISVFTSRASLGTRLLRWRLLLIPEEMSPPDVVQKLRAAVRASKNAQAKEHGFTRILTDPFAYAVHLGFLRRKSPASAKLKESNKFLQEKVILDGPAELSKAEIAHLVLDADTLTALHHQRRLIGKTRAVAPAVMSPS
jgi:membrane glycosyltransferase